MYVPVVPSKNHTRLQTKMGKVFSDQVPPDPDPFHDCWRPRQGLQMGEKNSIFIRLMIQRTGQHTSTKN